jgi:hypothetical protein
MTPRNLALLDAASRIYAATVNQIDKGRISGDTHGALCVAAARELLAEIESGEDDVFPNRPEPLSDRRIEFPEELCPDCGEHGGLHFPSCPHVTDYDDGGAE